MGKLTVIFKDTTMRLKNTKFSLENKKKIRGVCTDRKKQAEPVHDSLCRQAVEGSHT